MPGLGGLRSLTSDQLVGLFIAAMRGPGNRPEDGWTLEDIEWEIRRRVRRAPNTLNINDPRLTGRFRQRMVRVVLRSQDPNDPTQRPPGRDPDDPEDPDDPDDPDEPPVDPDAPTASDFATLRRLLDRYGLGSLYDQAADWLRSGMSDDEIVNQLWDTNEFQTRFRGIFMREANGMPAISVEEYLAYENQAFQLMREFGYPPGFYDDPDDFATLIGNNVSVNELQQRVSAYADVAAVGREQVRTELARQFGEGVGEAVDELSDGELAAWMIDPSRGLQAIRQRVSAAQVGAGAVDAGWGPLSFLEASDLTGRGITEAGARDAFGTLARQGDVTGTLAGEDTGSGMSRQGQLGVVGGEAAALTEIEGRRRKRQGVFEGGGGFATGREGIAGVGRA